MSLFSLARMADALRPYIFGAPSSIGAADADTSRGGDVKREGRSDSDGGGVPLLTISDINPDMLQVNELLSYVADDCCFLGWLVSLSIPSPSNR